MAIEDLVEQILDAVWPNNEKSAFVRWGRRIVWIGLLLALAYCAYLVIRLLAIRG